MTEKLVPHQWFTFRARAANAKRKQWGRGAALLLAFCLVPALPAQPLDAGAWGSDHVGKPVPEFTSGDECLFCHRMDIGPSWATNRHGQTIRAADPQALKKMPALADLAGTVELILGSGNRARFLKRGDGHGRLDLLIPSGKPHWDTRTFGDRCAGCHATGVDGGKRTFAAISIDCFACHGEVPDKHTKEPALVLLSRKRNDAARVVTSICAQCHLRTGTAKSTGLPYANNFVAGDNLFRDFRVDLSDETLKKLNPGDRHVQENVRDVVLLGKEDVTCLSCHDVHRSSSRKHHRVAHSDLCLNCHPMGSKKVRIPYEVHSPTCGY